MQVQKKVVQKADLKEQFVVASKDQNLVAMMDGKMVCLKEQRRVG
jgi:hypothetical protein